MKDRNARASGKADAMEGDDVVQEVGGVTIPADEGGQGDEGSVVCTLGDLIGKRLLE